MVNSKSLFSWQRWRNAGLYLLMVFIILGLLLILHVVDAMQDTQFGERRVEVAYKVSGFELPSGYELTTAIYAIHPHFFVLTNPGNQQKIRVYERRWWTKHRTPEGFKEKFFHPQESIRKPGLGFDSIVIEQTEIMKTQMGQIPYVTGQLFSSSGENNQDGLLACIYNDTTGKSIRVFASAPPEVFESTPALELIESLDF